MVQRVVHCELNARVITQSTQHDIDKRSTKYRRVVMTSIKAVTLSPSGRTRLSVLIAGVPAAANVAADNVDEMISALEETREPAKPARATSEAMERAVAARKGLGFRSDPDFVRQILESPENVQRPCRLIDR